MLLLPGPAPSRADDNQTAKSESKPDTTTVEFDKKPAEDDAPFAPAAVGVTEDLPEAVTQPFPKSIDDLRTIQEQVRKVRDIAIKTTVGIIAGGGTGSGVLISKDGYVLTAGHVSGQPGRNVTIILPDGKRVRGKTLGANHGVDSGLIKITEKGEYDHADIGDIDDLKPGAWCLATGHPGGWQADRPAVVRVGRLLGLSPTVVWTDCTLVGGDSGGPLFDMHGRVVGIHSRISAPTTVNFHVPVDTYEDTWQRLASSETWGGQPFLGVKADDHEKGAVITEVVPGSAAARARLRVGDVVTKFDDEVIKGFRGLVNLVRRKTPGDAVVVEILREDKPKSIKLKLTRAPGN